MKKKKILFLMYSMGENRGTEKLFSQLSHKLKENYELFFVSFFDIKPYDNFTGKYFFLNKNIRIKFVYKILNIFKLRRIIKENNIDIVVGTNDLLNIILLFSTLFLKIKKIGTIHSNPLLNFNNIIKRFVIKLFYPVFYKVICVSNTQELIMIEKFKLRNTKTIYNFFDIKKELLKFNQNLDRYEENSFKNKFNFIMISRLDRLKGFLPTLRIFKELTKKYKNINLIIIGEGEYRKSIERYIFENNLTNNIHLFGSKKNIYPYLLKSDCFLFPSLSEAFGLVLIEALLTNKLIVSADCNIGPKEILNTNIDFGKILNYPYYGEYGLLVEAFNNRDLDKYELNKNKNLDNKEKILFNLLKDIYLNTSKYLNQYPSGRKRAENFDINNIINDWKKIFL